MFSLNAHLKEIVKSDINGELLLKPVVEVKQKISLNFPFKMLKL